MIFVSQPTLNSENILIRPLLEEDFEDLYEVAKDPQLWKQHPNSNRYKKPIFEKFFNEAIESKNAVIIIDLQHNKIIGSSRYYDLDYNKSTVTIGYTFIDRTYWGNGTNKLVKLLMIEHAFKYFKHIRFSVGVLNLRSRKAIEKLNAQVIEEINKTEPKESKVVYQISR